MHNISIQRKYLEIKLSNFYRRTGFVNVPQASESRVTFLSMNEHWIVRRFKVPRTQVKDQLQITSWAMAGQDRPGQSR